MKKVKYLLFILFASCPLFVGSQEKKEEPPYFQPDTEFYRELHETEKKGDDRFFKEFLNMLFTLGLLVGVLLLASWFLKRMLNTRMQQVNVTSTIKILERRNLSPKSVVYLLDVAGKGMIIGESSGGIANLGECTIEKEPTFGKVLQNQIDKDMKKGSS